MVQNSDSQQPPPQTNNDASKPAADASAEKKDEKAAPVRKRLSLACTTCRQRKVKCDGGRPSCRTCAKFNWPCIYQPSNRKRGPRPRALALMDGSMPYSGRQHWPGAHYYTYGIPGQPQMSPPLPMPPPPAIHQLMPPMPGQQLMDVPTNGAPVHANMAHGNVGGYNYDAYSTYSDYIASTGGIRIRPQAPPHPAMPQQHPPMHGMAFNPAAPHPVHMPGGPARHRSGSQFQQPPQHPLHQHQHQHRMSISDAPSTPMPPPPYAQGHVPAQSQTLAPVHRGPSPFSPYSHRGAHSFSGNSGASSHNPAQQAAHMQLSPTAPGHMRVPPAGSELQRAPGQQSAINPPGSTAPQHMHASAQSYTSASANAHDMQLASTDASRHTPAIYARRETDVASSRSSSSSGGCGIAGAGRRLSQQTPPLHSALDAAGLSSPMQPHSDYPRAGAEQAMTAPIPSTAAFPLQKHPSDHPHEYRPYALARAEHAEPATAPAQPLPFSDGVSRPRLPPLSEVLGKDYQLILSPGSEAPGRANALASQFGGPAPPLRKDTFASEASHIAFEGTR
ncbi:hypothetical protein GGF43_004919 [Coemansia sp. RSA 2618]|nr:hypothetical protein GGF43_004919 [Coemansia sp. RSA 2618]